MKEVVKEIKLDGNKTIEYVLREENIPMHIITYTTPENRIQRIQFTKRDDYNIRAYHGVTFSDYIKSPSETIIFNKSNPLYIPLLHLLNGEDELIIEDDDTLEYNEKYLRIYKEEENIITKFIYNRYDNTDIERFNIFIKNINFDLRSKIDCSKKDTKDRLYFFFDELYNSLMKDNHQISMEEYLLQNQSLTTEESKKFVKKFPTKWNRY